MPTYNSNTLVSFDMLDSDMKEKLNQYTESESDNLDLANENKTLISTLGNDINNMIASLNELSELIITKFNNESANIAAYNGTITGIGQILKHTNRYGLKGQLFKSDYHYKQRSIPGNGLTIVRLCNVENQDAVLRQNPMDENDKYAYNTDNQRVYFLTDSNNWVLYEPTDDSRLLFLYNNFIYDPVSKKMWYSVNPHEMIYLWTAKTPFSNVTNTISTPRVQSGIEVVPKDIGEGDLNNIDYEMTVKNLIGISAEQAKRPDQIYQRRILVGSGRYFKDYNLLRNNPYQFKFNSRCDGPAKLVITFKWDMNKAPYPEESLFTKFLDLHKDWNTYSKGIITVSIDNMDNTITLNRESFNKWERSIELISTNLTKGEHTMNINVEAEPLSHLFLNEIVIFITHI